MTPQLQRNLNNYPGHGPQNCPKKPCQNAIKQQNVLSIINFFFMNNKSMKQKITTSFRQVLQVRHGYTDEKRSAPVQTKHSFKFDGHEWNAKQSIHSMLVMAIRETIEA